MEDVQFPAQAIRQKVRGLDDHLIQGLGVAVHMGRVHARDDTARLPGIRALHQEERTRAGADQVPVGVVEECAVEPRIVAGGLDDHVGPGARHLLHDAVEGMPAEDRIGCDGQPMGLGQRRTDGPEPLQRIADLRLRGRPAPRAMGRRSWLAHEDLEPGAGLARQERRALQRRLRLGLQLRRAQDHEKSLTPHEPVALNRYACSRRRGDIGPGSVRCCCG